MTMNVLLFPWLAHVNISPFLELGKKLYNTNVFNIYLCSTPINLYTVKTTLDNNCDDSSFIQLIELHLPSLPELPPHRHTNTGLPLHLIPTLKQACDMASPQFSRILRALKPDLLIYDMLQPWAPVEASAFGIPSVAFITTNASSTMVYLQLTSSSNGIASKFSNTINYSAYVYEKVSKSLDQSLEISRKDRDRIMGCISNSSSIVLVKSFKEIEGKNIGSLSVMTDKKIVPVGPLIACPSYLHMKHNNVIEWLNTKATRSTVFVSLGGDSPSSVDLAEIALGLEKSNVNFVWVSSCPKFEECLPLGFRKRVKNRGLLVEGWIPPIAILRHKSIGGFVSDCFWSSVIEAMKLGVPIIAMPMKLDQPVNARLVAEIGVGVEVVRDGNGLLSREKVAAVVQHVVVSMLGKVVREKAKKLSGDLRARGEEDFDVVVKELLRLCKSRGSCHGRDVGQELQVRKDTFASDCLDSSYGEEEQQEADDSTERFITRFYEGLRNIMMD